MTSGEMCQHCVMIIDKGQSQWTFRFFQHGHLPKDTHHAAALGGLWWHLSSLFITIFNICSCVVISI